MAEKIFGKSRVNFDSQAIPPKHKLVLWYTKPAQQWDKEALPIGNGDIGGMVFGGVSEDVIQYNEKSLWEGGPIDGDPTTYNNGIRKGGVNYLEQIRQKIWAGDNEGALADGNEYMTGDYTNIGNYQNFGEIILSKYMPSDVSVTNYCRELDLEDSIARTSYTYNGVNYLREYFLSYPDNVMVIRLSADQKEKLSFEIGATSAQENGVITADNDTITTKGTVACNKMKFKSQIKVTNDGGTRVVNGDKIRVENANSIVIIMSCGTNYANNYPVFRGIEPDEKIASDIKNASNKTFDELLATHQADYKKLFGRFTLDLNDEKPTVPTNELRGNYKNTKDHAMEVLLFQYGRYLLISSSRENRLPANLQGVWNNSNAPAWRSGYQVNINLQMNYWDACTTNLSECELPLIHYIPTLCQPGKITAKEYYGIENGCWVMNSTNTPFGYTAPGAMFTYGNAPNSAAFICQNLYDYYLFTEDKQLLKEKIYPTIRDAAKFWIEYLVEDKINNDGTLVCNPSYSPEHGDLTYASAMDQQTVDYIFTCAIKLGEILGVDEELRNIFAEKKSKLSPPVIIGSLGQVIEWKDENVDIKYNQNLDPHHRHTSQLSALHPYNIINKNTPEFMEAAKITLGFRGDWGTGWGRAWKLNFWARLLDGNRVYSILEGLINDSIYDNLFDTHPPFQIDGNFGYVSAVCEMIMQSHIGEIDLLPALPNEWKKGSVKGMVARGNFEIDMDWNYGLVENVVIKSKNGNECKIRQSAFSDKDKYKLIKVSDNSSVDFTLKDDLISFKTQVGETYKIVWKK